MTTYWKHCRFEGSSTSSPPWELKCTDDRGYIAISTRNFAPGDLICIEKPLFYVLSHTPNQRMVMDQVNKLNDEDKAAFYDMSHTSSEECEVGIVKTNAFDMVGSELGANVSGMYCAIARLNHSCAPNTQQTHYPDTMEEYLHCTSAISVGDELCDCYINLLQSRASRRQELITIYGFTCECSACTRPDFESDDRLRVQASLLEDAVISTAEEGCCDDALALNEQLLGILYSAGNTKWTMRYRAAAHMSACMLHSALLERSKAIDHLVKALEQSTLSEGPASPQTRHYKSTLVTIRAQKK